jgi:carbamate kinase
MRSQFPKGSMNPKVEETCRFVDANGRRAMIGRLEDVAELMAWAVNRCLRSRANGLATISFRQ